jgi:hypothetical protein
MLTSELNRLWPPGVYLVKPRRRRGRQGHEDSLMIGRTALAFLAVVLLALPAKAMDCPADMSDYEARENAVRKAATCKQSLEVMSACSYGASGDTGLGEALRERCEPEFLPRLSKAQRRVYDREQKRCTTKDVNKSGSMYVSFSAFCRAESMVKYAAKYGVRK